MAATVEIIEALGLVLMLSFCRGYLTVVAIVTLEVRGVINGLCTEAYDYFDFIQNIKRLLKNHTRNNNYKYMK